MGWHMPEEPPETLTFRVVKATAFFHRITMLAGGMIVACQDDPEDLYGRYAVGREIAFRRHGESCEYYEVGKLGRKFADWEFEMLVNRGAWEPI